MASISNSTISRWVEIYDGELAYSNRVISGGSLYVSSGGTANSNIVDYSGSMLVSSGGTANSTTVNYFGRMSVASGGTANDTIVCSFYAALSVGGTANNTTIYDSGSMYVNSGGTANVTSINEGGWMSVNGGGMANSITINSRGSMGVARGGTANIITLSHGRMSVTSGGTALQITENGGAVYVADGASVTFVPNSFSGLVLSNDATVHSGTTANSTTVKAHLAVYNSGIANDTIVISNGSMSVSSGGTANATTINSSGILVISSGGTANATTLNSYGRLYVSSGGTANMTFVNSALGFLYGDGMFVYDGGIAISTTLSPGRLTLFSGGTAIETTLSYGGQLYIYSGGMANSVVVNSGVLSVSSGGTALEIKENGGYVDIADTAEVTFISNTISGLVAWNTTVHSGTTAIETTVNSNGSLSVFSGGTANGTIVNNGGLLSVFSGGTANEIILNEGGYLTASSGVILNKTTINGGRLSVSSGGTANSTTVNSGHLSVFSGGTANETTLTGGALFVSSGGTANNTSLNADGSLLLYVGGTVNNTTVNAGWMTVSCGVTANETTVNAGGTLKVSSGGTALQIKENGGNVSFENGANVTFTPNSFSGLVLNDGQIATVHSGTTATATTVNSGGRLHIYSGGIHTGRLTINPGNFTLVSAYEGSIIDFTVSEHTADGTALINNLSLIRGAPSFTITVSETQAKGIYVLAEGAAGFSRTISIGTETENYGSLTVNGDILHTEATDFALSLNAGILSLYVAATPEAPTVNADITEATNQNVTVTAQFDDNSELKQYSMDGNLWQTYNSGIVMQENGTLFFRAANIFGTFSEVTEFTVSNIDKVAPEAPTTNADITTPTNQNVTVTAVFSDDSAIKEYSLNGLDWNVYTDPVIISENGTVSFRGTDEAGNISEVTSYTVTNIDKLAPEAPTASADVTTPTNQDVTVTAVFSDDSALKEYSLNSEDWNVYIDPVIISENGTVYFRGTDEAGNISEVTTYSVTNIDKVAPEAPAASADITTPTNQNVIVTAVFSDDSVIKEYSLNGLDWNVYTDPVIMSANGTVSFRGTDEAGNISDVTEYSVSNIDKVAPEAPTANADITTPTNQDVTVTAVFSEDSAVKEYSLNGADWNVYTDSVIISENGTVSFRGTDEAGNISEVTTYSVTNIDKVAPEAPTASSDVTAATNQDVTVTAVFSADSAIKEYSLNGLDWNVYTDPIIMTENGTVSFRGTDEAGNVSEVTSFTVSNIDKIAPDKPTATADIVEITNGNVTVSAVFSEDSVSREYSRNNSTWQTYTSGIVFEQNGTIYFRGKDVAGNISEVTEYSVTNIDKVAPNAPVVSADITSLTNQNVTLTAIYPNDSVIKQYSLDGTNWNTYVSGVEMSENGTVYFRGISAASNISDVTAYSVTNIDKVAPEAPTTNADITTPTNQDVTVTAVFSADSAIKEYSLNGEDWNVYIDPVIISENGTVYFRGTDEAGNQSDVTSYTVSNIDKVAPEAPTASADITTATNQDVTVTAEFSADSAIKEYSLNGLDWNVYIDPVIMSANGAVYFRGTDEAGNQSDVTTYSVTNINKVAPDAPTASADITAPTNMDVTVAAEFSEDSAVKEYSLNGIDWIVYTEPITLSANGTVSFRGTDEAGNISDVTTYSVTNIDKIAPDAPTASADVTTPTNQNVTVTAVFSADSALKEYSLNGEDWNVYIDPVIISENGTIYFRGTDEAGNISEVTTYSVTNIDKVAPEAPTASADITAPTNMDVTVTAEFSEDSALKEYSLNGIDWIVYTEPITLSANGTVSFRGTDEAGNISEVTTYSVTNIDKIAPNAPSASADVTTPTNQDVTVTAVFSNDSVTKQYSYDGNNWSDYTVPVVMTENGTLYFRGTDEAGNDSNVTSYTVTNIEKNPPASPIVSADITAPTNQDVTVTAVFDPASSQNEYCINGGIWTEYGSGVVFKSNGLVSFRSKSAAGVYSETVNYAVENIDKTAPNITVTSSNTEPNTMQPVFVIAEFYDENGVTSKQYSYDNETWENYTTPIVMKRNGILYFQAEDAAGNIGDKVFIVSNMAAPQELTATVQKYNIKLNWMKFAVPKGVKVVYQIDCDGKIYTSKSNQYTIKKAEIGTHTISVRAVLSNGNTTAWSSEVQKTVADITAPKARALTVKQTDADSVQLVWKPGTDNDKIDHYVVTCGKDSKTVSDSTLSAEFSGMSGKVTATMTAYDAAGNVSKTVKKTITLKDVTPPEQVTVFYDSEVNNKSGGVLSWEAPYDNVGVTQYLISVEDENGKKTSYTSKTNSLKLKKLKAGDYKFTVVAVDKAKNKSKESDICVFEVEDKIAPNIKKFSAKVNKDNSATVTWNVTDETKFDSVKLTLDKNQYQEETFDSDLADGTLTLQNLSAGSHTILMTAYDAAGNPVEESISFKIKGALAAK